MKATRDTVRSTDRARRAGLWSSGIAFSRHVVRVRLPWEVGSRGVHQNEGFFGSELDWARHREADFLEKEILRESIHDREGGPVLLLHAAGSRATNGASTMLCTGASRREYLPQSGVLLCGCATSAKQARSAEEFFLRWLYRERKLSVDELGARLRAVQMLAAGKLIPQIDSSRAVSK